ncbi:MAG: hypothetical protein KDB21_18360 [Acidimicrobiales bacterium]|nr:hypothetical protein [Acidimicrobiales bacterium]
MTLVERIVALHRALSAAELPHAFGGALALAWCTERARGTIDIDLNLFVDVGRLDDVIGALPPQIEVTETDRAAIVADGQTRLWWDTTPVDVFFNTTPFHDTIAGRARIESFAGADVPFLACRDLAVFKAFFDRTKDWADLEEMAAADTLDVEAVLGVLVHYLGGDDPRIARLRALG